MLEGREAPCADVRLVGCDTEVACADGRRRRYVNLDYAASTPALPAVWQAVEAFVPWYSSVHRGSGMKSRLATDAFEGARADVADFLGAPPDADVVFTANTTGAVNVLAAALPAGTRVLTSPVEHHANMLPWRRHDDLGSSLARRLRRSRKTGAHGARLLPFTASADALCEAAERILASARPRIGLLAVTGASNVTGEVWPIERLAAIAHRHGARIFVDAAQLAPHRAIDMAAAGIDFLALSGHKLYAPFGAGVLVGPVHRLGDAAPLLHGGGAIKLVTADEVLWADVPDRHEAGSPNVVGVVALGAACRALGALGMDAVANHERALADRLRSGLASVAGLEQLSLWSAAHVDRVGVASFALRGYRHPLLAAILSAEHAIGVRHGCFCAHPLIAHLLGILPAEIDRLRAELAAGGAPPLPGAVRASLGLGTTAADVDRLVGALHDVARRGPSLAYRRAPGHDEYEALPAAA